MSAFDPDAPAGPHAGVFGLPHHFENAACVLAPLPFDATTSYRAGAADGPHAIREASGQVDLEDPVFGAVYEAGIFMADSSRDIRSLSAKARSLAAPIIERGGAGPRDAGYVREIDGAGERVNELARSFCEKAFEREKIPGIVGGDHACAYGAIAASAARFGKEEGGFGVLQIDAHLDLRDAYEGFQWSHASVMHNVATRLEDVARIVCVGVRDVGRREMEMVGASGERLIAHFDHDWWRRLDEGESFRSLAARAVEALPRRVHVSFDIDGLDPSLCPHTGTPVPGGLTHQQATCLLETLAACGRRVVSFDLCEVRPGPGQEDVWDAAVGARVLYRLCGAALLSQGRIDPARGGTLSSGRAPSASLP